jgi:hypothetical protein
MDLYPDRQSGRRPHNLVITATDPAGNTSTGSTTVTFTVDTSAPVAPIISSVIDNVGTTVTLAMAIPPTTPHHPLAAPRKATP